MTPSQINAAIAAWMGWADISTVFHVGINPETGQPCPVPNYHGDLNACWDAEEKLGDGERLIFCEQLVGLTISAGWTRFDFVHATAPQRAEALLRSLNLWKEE